MQLIRQEFNHDGNFPEVLTIDFPEQTKYREDNYLKPLRYMEKYANKAAADLGVDIQTQYDPNKNQLAIAFKSNSDCDALINSLDPFKKEIIKEAFGKKLRYAEFLYRSDAMGNRLTKERRDRVFQEFSDDWNIPLNELEEVVLEIKESRPLPEEMPQNG